MNVMRTHLTYRPEQAGAYAEDAYPPFRPGVQPACAGTDPEMWFPPPSTDTLANLRLKAICHGCPEYKACRSWALNQTSWLFGVWGGTTRRERMAIRRRRARRERLRRVAA